MATPASPGSSKPSPKADLRKHDLKSLLWKRGRLFAVNCRQRPQSLRHQKRTRRRHTCLWHCTSDGSLSRCRTDKTRRCQAHTVAAWLPVNRGPVPPLRCMRPRSQSQLPTRRLPKLETWWPSFHEPCGLKSVQNQGPSARLCKGEFPMQFDFRSALSRVTCDPWCLSG
jgi:hypothetical protein